jgi:transcription-repair coupling factor (superfamily II helicase)
LIFDEPSRIKEHGDAVELEFRESMSHRGEKGYVLPGQMNLLQSMDKTLAEVQKVCLADLTKYSNQTAVQLKQID